MVAVFERKDGTSIVCSSLSRQRHSSRRIMVYQLVLAAACMTAGIWLLVT
jgi:hypothetical protein